MSNKILELAKVADSGTVGKAQAGSIKYYVNSAGVLHKIDESGTDVEVANGVGAVVRLLSAQASTGVGNTLAAETDLMTFTIPASTLSASGCVVDIEAFGMLAANGNTKTVRVYFGATKIAETVLSINGQPWSVRSEVVARTASAQTAYSYTTSDFGIISTDASMASTPAQSVAATIQVRVTGQGTATNDITQRALVVRFTPAIG